MPRRKKETDTPSLSTKSSGQKKSIKNKKQLSDNAVTSTEQDELTNMVKQQLSEYIRKSKSNERVSTELSSVVQEYLSSFIILGYTFDGSPMNIVSVENQLDADAIGTLIHRFIANSQRNNSPGDYPPITR